MDNRFIMDTAIRDDFWQRFRELVRVEGIPYQWKALNDQLPDTPPSYCMRNFRVAAGREAGEHAGCVFQDSDVAKWLEGVAYSLKWHPDPALEAVADGAIADIVSAQQPDGYLDTYYIINGLDKRFTNLCDNHELYCAGHMIEAAVAYYQVTGKRALLDAMIRYVDCIDAHLGPEEGKKHGYPGHPVIEMALARLYAVTGDEKHLRLAKYFIDQRGQAPLYFREEQEKYGNRFPWTDASFQYQYYQAGKPVREQTEAEGHAVRAVYLYSGMADVARLTDDESLKIACRRLWDSIVRRRMYITGAIGSSEYGESFSFDYDLPNDTVYGETCASIGLMFFARRMLEMEIKSEYADVMERALYNGVISGMQLDGKKFFYVNPLEVLPEACFKDNHKRHVMPERQGWFNCACCPPNLVRLLASLEQYVYSCTGDTLYVHLYAGSATEATLNGAKVRLTSQTGYPWDGRTRFEITGAGEYCLALRVPGWCRKYALEVNGSPFDAPVENGYLMICRQWSDGDTVTLDMDMPVEVMQVNPRVPEDVDKVAVTRGPVVYCLEQADNGPDLHLIKLGDGPFETTWRPELLSGVVTIAAPGLRQSAEDWGDALYMPRRAQRFEPVTLTFIPYYAWANRGLGEMRVFVREQ